jgi:hypothetical protein
MADSPVAFWPLQETTGDYVDLVAGNHATVNGTVTRGVSGMGITGLPLAAQIGTSGQLSPSDAAALRITGDITIECWIKPSSITEPGRQWDKGVQSYSCYIDTTGTMAFGTDGTVNFYISSAGLVVVNTVYHVVHTRAGTACQGYLNGATAAGANASNGSAALGNAGTAPRIGQDTGTANQFRGLIAGVAIYNKALNASQVAAHYAARNTASGSNPGRRSAPPPFVATIPANLPPGLGGTPPGQAKKQNESPAARRRRTLDDYRRLRRRT